MNDNRITLKQRVNGWYQQVAPHLTGRIGKWIAAALFAISLLIIAQIFYTNWDILVNYPWQIRPFWLIVALLFFIIDLLLATLGWHLIVKRFAQFNNFRRSAKICWSANLANRLPGPVWYIAGRAILYEKEGIKKTTVSILSSLELLMLLVSGILATLITVPFGSLSILFNEMTNYQYFLVLLLLLPLLAHPQLLAFIWQKINREALQDQLTWQDTISWMSLYVLVWSVGGLVLFALLAMLQPTSLHILPAVIGMWSLSNAISLTGSLTISVIGLREISLTLLLSQFTPIPIALLVSVLIRLVWMGGEAASAFVSLKL